MIFKTNYKKICFCIEYRFSGLSSIVKAMKDFDLYLKLIHSI